MLTLFYGDFIETRLAFEAGESHQESSGVKTIHPDPRLLNNSPKELSSRDDRVISIFSAAG